MRILRRRRWSAVAWLLFPLLVLAEGGGIGALRASHLRLLARRQELLAQLQSYSPSNSVADGNLAEELTRLRDRRTQLLAGFPEGAAGDPSTPPSTSTDAFFEVARFVERMRASAAAAHTSLRVGEYFGFSAYSSEGPELPLIPAVRRQCRVIGQILDGLLAAGPAQILGIQRERIPLPEGIAKGAARNPVSAAPGDRSRGFSDFFELERNGPARLPEGAISTAFRVSFAGETETLRTFLNNLAHSDPPTVVRMVEASPLESKVQSPTATVSHGSMRFDVSVERIEFPGVMAPGGTRDSPVDVAWLPPKPQSRGEDWIYDLFTPPDIYYDPQRQVFFVSRRGAVAPPTQSAEVGISDESPREPTLRLAGFFGAPGSYLGVFENTAANETLVAGAGQHFADLGLSIVRISVEAGDVEAANSILGNAPRATAVLRDDGTGREITLTNKRPHGVAESGDAPK